MACSPSRVLRRVRPKRTCTGFLARGAVLITRPKLEHPSPTNAHKVGKDIVINRYLPVDFGTNFVFVHEAVKRVMKGGGQRRLSLFPFLIALLWLRHFLASPYGPLIYWFKQRRIEQSTR
jgi:hypothetical protein